MRRGIKLAGTKGAERERHFKRFLLAAALCALAVFAAGCGSSGKAGEDQEVAWETREKDGEEEAGNASDASNETGEREGNESGENGGKGQSAEGETAGGKTGAENSAVGKDAVGENADGAAAVREHAASGNETPAASAADLEYPFTERVNASKVEDMVKQVRASWTRDREAMDAGRYDKRSESTMDVYEDNGDIVMIEVGIRNENNPYSATYEFEDGKLIFAYYVGEGCERRLYYHNDSLFRLNTQVDGKQTIKDAAYEDEEFIQWHKMGLYNAYLLYQVAEGGVAADSSAPVKDADFRFRSPYREALGNTGAYLTDTFGDPDDFYYGDQGEVADTNWYTYQNPFCFFDLRRSADSVRCLISNAGTVFEMSKDSYTLDEVEAYLGTTGGETYEGESVEGSFSETGDLVFGCNDGTFYYDFILENGRVTRDSRCEIGLVQ